MIGSKRRLAVMVLVVVMLFTMVLFQSGCGTSKDNQASSAATADGSTAAQTTAKPAEPVELTMLTPLVNNAQVGVQDDPVAKQIEKDLGIRMNITAANAVSDINAKIAAMIASDDMPDITYFASSDLMQSSVTANVLLPLDDLIEKYGQDLKKNVPMMLNYSKTNMSVGKDGKSDGKTYILGGMPVGRMGYEGFDSYAIPWVRWDLYKKLGYPSVDSIDDYLPLIKQMVALEPKSPDGKKTYGVGSFLGSPQWDGDTIVWATISSIYGFTVNTYANVVDLISNDFINFLGDPDSKFYAATKFWNQAYRQGLMDPESFTMKKEDYINRVTQGRYVFSFLGQHTIDYNANSKKNGEKEKYFVQLPPPKDTKAVWVVLNQPVGTPTSGVGISKKTKYPELAMKFLNYCASVDGCMTITNGVKGQTWDMVDGKPQLLPGIYDKFITGGTNFVNTTGAGKYGNLSFVTEPTKFPEMGGSYLSLYTTYGFEHPEFDPMEQDFCDHFGVKNPMELILKQAQIVASAPENALIPAFPADVQDMSNNIDKFAFDNFVKLILAKTDDSYNAEKAKFMEGAKQAGNDTVVKWLQDERVKAVEKFNSLTAGQ